jgi:rubredoxin
MNKLKQFIGSDCSLPWLVYSLGLLFAVTYPIFTYEYLFHDDWIHFSGTCPMFDWFMRLGRPLGAAILCFQFSLFHQIGDAWIARGITFIGMASLLVAIYIFLRREHFPDNLSALVAFGCATLPGALVSAYWLGGGFIIFSLLASVFSVLLCQSAIKQEMKDIRFYCLILTAILAEIASALIYQTGTMMFLVFAAVATAGTLKKDDHLSSRQTLIYGGIFTAANLSYFLFFKYFLANELARTNPERGIFFNELGSGFVWFTQTALPRAIRLWFVEMSANWSWMPSIIGLIFITSLGLYIFSLCYKKFSRRIILRSVLYVIIIILLGIGCLLPVLASGFRANVFRSLTPLSSFIFSMTCIQLWFALPEKKSQIQKSNYLIVPIMMLIAFSSHNVLLNKMILPKSAEVRYLRNTMQTAKTSGRGNLPVHVIIPLVKESWKTDEIGYLTASFYYFGDVQAMIGYIRDELELPNTNVTYSMTGADFNPEGKVIADFSVLANSGIVGSSGPDFSTSIKNKSATASPSASRYVCTICGYVYDPIRGDPAQGIAPGTKFEDLPASWKCPGCGSHK